MSEYKFTTPTLYNYNPTTREFCGVVRAEVDMAAIAEGVIRFVTPAFTTPVAPPSPKPSHVAVFDPEGNAWREVVDRRGEVWWRGMDAVHIADLGDPADAGLTPNRPEPEVPVVDPIEERKATVLSRINVLVTLGAGFTAMKQPVPQAIREEHEALAAEYLNLTSSQESD